MNKILIQRPRTNDGGLANYFNSLKDKFVFDIVFFYRGAKDWPEKKGYFETVFRIINDYISFAKIVHKKEYSLIHLNIFFDFKGLLRESVFLIISKLFKRKVIVFFRGWNMSTKERIEKHYLSLFKLIYFKADSIIVLSSTEQKILKSWGYKKPLYIETTVVDDSLIKSVSREFLDTKFTNVQNYRLLFLSRVEKAKGIYETIDAFNLLKDKYKNLQLTIAGVGSELDNVKEYIQKHNISDIYFEGFVSGKKKIEVFNNSHIFIFPSYSEGMPNAVLEAFSFGLPVITRYVGGLVDIFQNDVNGFITESKDPVVFAGYIEKLIVDKELTKEISMYNYKYAQENFISTIVVKRLEKIYKSLLD